jgi:hypothetical protein
MTPATNPPTEVARRVAELDRTSGMTISTVSESPPSISSSTGKLTGYAGGLRRKQLLLDLEREVVDRPTRLF